MPQVRYNFRENTAAGAAASNPVLGPSEPGVETDTGKFKLGDGRTPWNDLPYYIHEDEISEMIQAAIQDLGSGTSDPALLAHVESETPHPVYDEVPSLALLYENVKAG
jgi:hypothetical protein